MVHCFYHGRYAELSALDDAPDWKSAYQLYATMYALGDSHDITVLKDTALVSLKELTAKPQSDLLGLVESIPTVFSSTLESDRNLRDAMLAKVKSRPFDFLHEDVKVSYKRVLCEVPDFSWDLH